MPFHIRQHEGVDVRKILSEPKFHGCMVTHGAPLCELRARKSFAIRIFLKIFLFVCSVNITIGFEFNDVVDLTNTASEFFFVYLQINLSTLI